MVESVNVIKSLYLTYHMTTLAGDRIDFFFVWETLKKKLQHVRDIYSIGRQKHCIWFSLCAILKLIMWSWPTHPHHWSQEEYRLRQSRLRVLRAVPARYTSDSLRVLPNSVRKMCETLLSDCWRVQKKRQELQATRVFLDARSQWVKLSFRGEL